MITARYTSKCSDCGLQIRQGDEIERGVGSYRHTYRHVDCTAASVQHQIADRVAEGWDARRMWTWLNASVQLTVEQRISASNYYAGLPA
jgi:hypothetical protein